MPRTLNQKLIPASSLLCTPEPRFQILGLLALLCHCDQEPPGHNSIDVTPDLIHSGRQKSSNTSVAFPVSAETTPEARV